VSATGTAIVSTFILSNAARAGSTLYVTNDGTDSAGCGARAHACRSISQGLANATDGDTNLVGAGRYGNISGGASYTGAGDEQPQQFSYNTRIDKLGTDGSRSAASCGHKLAAAITAEFEG
jgi:hypothetical protein